MNGSSPEEVTVPWGPLVLNIVDLNFTGPGNVLPPGHWSILVANPILASETVTVAAALVLTPG